MRSNLGAILAAAALVSACATSPTGRRQFILVSESEAISASREAYLTQMTELNQAGKIVEDPAVVRRVEGITSKLVAQAVMVRPETADWEWSVEVIDEPETVNAWCMAGGRMAVYTGLIEKIMPSDDELAQVMGHEISHALANHTAERMSVAMATNAGVAIAGVLSENSVAAMTAAAAAASYAVQLPNSRTSESEADEIGIELAAKAGYDPRAAVTLWQKMGAASGEGPPQFMSTHPSPANRQQRLGELVPMVQPFYEAARGTQVPTYALRETLATP
jgi:predicted Zn-dependent protease